MRIVLSLPFLALLFACETTPVPPSSRESGRVDRAKVAAIVSTHKGCIQYGWKERGRAPIGYMKGIALLYAKHACSPSASTAEMKLPRGAPLHDALALYNKKDLGDLFTLLLGSGMRESSGRYCEGRDRSASNTSSDTAEAGLFQTSWNIRSASTAIAPLLKNYEADKSQCELVAFKEGVTCSAGDLANFGSGEGLRYQKLSKECPAFHAEITLIAMRKRVRHWGPLRDKTVEFIPACRAMFAELDAACLD